MTYKITFLDRTYNTTMLITKLPNASIHKILDFKYQIQDGVLLYKLDMNRTVP